MSAPVAPEEESVQQAVLAEGQTRASGPTENVDQIREILFGSQMREYGQRFANIEERLLHETGELKADVRRRLESLEAYTKQELSELAERLGTERTERSESAGRISQDLTDSVKSLERRLMQADDRVSRDLRDLRQLTLNHLKGLLDDLAQRIGMSEERQNRRLEELSSTTVDRLALANLLAELALRMRGEFGVQGMGDSTDAGANR
jgi:hypothetical protein